MLIFSRSHRALLYSNLALRQQLGIYKRKQRRPCIPLQHIGFICRISSDHPEYGEDRITLELEVKFGIKHSEATVRKYMIKAQGPRRPSQSWST
jgi:hypothetical protein